MTKHRKWKTQILLEWENGARCERASVNLVCERTSRQHTDQTQSREWNKILQQSHLPRKGQKLGHKNSSQN